jgi:hypothetical protein
LASVQQAVLAAVAASGGGAEPGEVKTFALDAAGNVPAGYAQINGPGNMPVVMGGLLAYFGNSKGSPSVNTGSSNVVARGNEAIWSNGGAVYSWTVEGGLTSLSLPAVPTGGMATLAFLPSGRLLSAGSMNGSFGSTSCYAGNFATVTWNQVAPLAVSRGWASLVALKDGKVACIGGSNAVYYQINAANLLATVETYNESNNTWTTGTSAPVRGIGQAVLLPSGLVLWVPTAYSPDGSTLVTNTNRAWLYNPTDSSWVETDSMPVGVTLNASSALVADAAGALLVGVSGTAGACRYTDGNAAGSRWTALKLDYPVMQASNARGGYGARLSDGQVFVPLSSAVPMVVNVQYNPGGVLVQARKI